MAEYNYLETVKNDVCNFIRDEINSDKIKELGSLEALSDYLNDTLFVEDSITGNASGSYFFNSYDAEEALAHNLDLAREALEERGYGSLKLNHLDAEWLDVVIRCYLLPQAIDEVLQEDFSDLYDDEEQEYE